jgi:hypothetical protein
VKRYSEPRAFRLLTFARRSRAEREARALDLVGAVLPEHTVRALAWLEERRFGFVARSFLVTAEFERSFDLRRIKTLRGPNATRRSAPCSRAAAHRRAAARGRVFAVTLRGKNVLLQPDTGRHRADRSALRARGRGSDARHRVRDLAILSLELRKFLDGECGARSSRLSRRGAELGARDARSRPRGSRRARGGARGTPHPALGAPKRAKRPLPPQPHRRVDDRTPLRGIGLSGAERPPARGLRGARRRGARRELCDQVRPRAHKRISSYFERRAIRRALAITGARERGGARRPVRRGPPHAAAPPVSARLVSCDYSPAMLRVFRRTCASRASSAARSICRSRTARSTSSSRRACRTTSSPTRGAPTTCARSCGSARAG